MKKFLPSVTLMAIDCVNVERAQKALNISSQEIKFAKVKLLTSLPTDDPRKTKIPPITSIEAFSEFCIKELHKYVDTEFVLLVQYDGFILNAGSWEDEFLNYDYIGAPWLVADWSVKDFQFPKKLLGKRVVGNGGFSLRSKKFLEITAKLAKKRTFKKLHPEDVVLCVWNRKEVENAGVKFAPTKLAMRFSIEGDDDIYDKQFGFHSLRWTDISKWIKENRKWKIKQIPKYENDVLVKKSKINGKGVFAKRDFKKGEIVLRWNPRLISKEEVYKLRQSKKHYILRIGKVCYLMQAPEKYVNHSCEPNTFTKNLSDVAKRNIKKGEEITSNYGKQDMKDFNCNCGSEKCKKGKIK